MVPFFLIPRTAVDVAIEYEGEQTRPVQLNLVAALPGIFDIR
jgi:hypothetical protein